MTKSSDTNLPMSPPATSDPRKILVGAGYRLPTAPAHVADQGKIRTGAGYRLPTERKIG
jgi:hypothetical protein